MSGTAGSRQRSRECAGTQQDGHFRPLRTKHRLRLECQGSRDTEMGRAAPEAQRGEAACHVAGTRPPGPPGPQAEAEAGLCGASGQGLSYTDGPEQWGDRTSFLSLQT